MNGIQSLPISEVLALAESDLDRRRGAVLVRSWKAASGASLVRTDGRGSRSSVACSSSRAAGRCTVLHSARPNPRAAVRAS